MHYERTLRDNWSTIDLPPHKHGGQNIISNVILKINGQIEDTVRTDDVRVLDNEVIASSAYNYALTGTQVKDIMNDGAVRFGPATGSP